MSVTTDDAWTLRGDRRGDGPVVAVLGHAMMVDRRTMDRPAGQGLASELAARGIEVLSFDARGHGQSGPGADIGGSWTYDDIVRRDVPAMIAAGREVAAGRRVVLVGHSLIGHAALIHAGLDPRRTADGIVALAPNLWAPHLERSAARRALKAASLRSWLAVTRAKGFFDTKGLGLGNTAEARAYVEQFWTMWRTDRLASPDGVVDYEDALGEARVSVLGVSSDGDRLFAHPDSVDAYLGLMTAADVEHRRLRGPDAPDHMGLVTSSRSHALWSEVADWILAG